MDKPRRLRLVFDLDDTLLDSNGADHNNMESVRRLVTPHARACALVRAAYQAGHGVAYLTGREEHVRAVTEMQLQVAGLPPGRLIMNGRWEGYDAMARYKARELVRERASLYVGDHEADANAAALAGVPFLHADHWRAGTLPLHLASLLRAPPPTIATPEAA